MGIQVAHLHQMRVGGVEIAVLKALGAVQPIGGVVALQVGSVAADAPPYLLLRLVVLALLNVLTCECVNV